MAVERVTKRARLPALAPSFDTESRVITRSKWRYCIADIASVAVEARRTERRRTEVYFWSDVKLAWRAALWGLSLRPILEQHARSISCQCRDTDAAEKVRAWRIFSPRGCIRADGSRTNQISSSDGQRVSDGEGVSRRLSR